MTRSFRRVPIVAVTSAVTDKPFKAAEHRRERRAVKVSLKTAAPLPDPRTFGDPWHGDKDGSDTCTPRNRKRYASSELRAKVRSGRDPRGRAIPGTGLRRHVRRRYRYRLIYRVVGKLVEVRDVMHPPRDGRGAGPEATGGDQRGLRRGFREFFWSTKHGDVCAHERAALGNELVAI
jgi:hypothetical protein